MVNYKLALISAKNFLQYCVDRRLYAFIGRIQPWGSPDFAPEGIQESTFNQEADFNDAVFAKQILTANSSLVIRRIDWVSGKIFDQWDNRDPLILNKDFYCHNSVGHVYKCLSNNLGHASTVEPNIIQTSPFTTADGYVWKYLYTVTNDDALAFNTPDFIPVKEIYTSVVGYENQYASQVAAVPGTVDRLDLIQSGTKYGAGTTITIVGDGTGATADLVIHPTTGQITSVSILTNGQNYTWADVVINDPAAIPGTGAFAQAVLSPIYGHGYSPAEELFASKVMVSGEILADEAGLIRGDISYRKLTLVSDPKLANGTFAVDSRYDNTTSVTLLGESGTFVAGEEVTYTGGSAFVAYVGTGVIYLATTVGVPNGVLTGTTSAATATADVVGSETFKISGSTFMVSYFDPKTKTTSDNISIRPVFSF